jgi:hypothetical protein
MAGKEGSLNYLLHHRGGAGDEGHRGIHGLISFAVSNFVRIRLAGTSIKSAK